MRDTPQGESGSGQAVKNIELVIGFLKQFSSLDDLDRKCIQELPEEMKEAHSVKVQELMSKGLKLMRNVYDAKLPFISDPVKEIKMAALVFQKG